MKRKILFIFSLFFTFILLFGFNNLNARSSDLITNGDGTFTYDDIVYKPIANGDIVHGKHLLFDIGSLAADLPDLFTGGGDAFLRNDKVGLFDFNIYGADDPNDLYNLSLTADGLDSSNEFAIYDSWNGENAYVVDCDSYSNIAVFDITKTAYIEIGTISSLNYSIKSIQVNPFIYIETVKTDKTPIINGASVGFVTDVDDPVSVDEIKASLTAIDNEDGDISHLIVCEKDDYTAKKDTLGTYNITFSVTDSAENKATVIVTVLVSDVTAPVISGPTTYNAQITTLTNVDTIKSLLSVSDNYDSVNDITFIVETNGYQANYNKVGTYNVIFKATDKSGNVSRHTVAVTVKDNVAPTFSGPTTILKNQSTTLTINDIKGQLSASDNVDGNITSKITVTTDNYSGCGNKAGQYTIVFKVVDTAGNEATRTVTVTVKDDIPPVFFVDDYFIKVSQFETISQEQIVDLLIASGQITNSSAKTITFTRNAYAGNEDQVGIYPVTVKVRSVDGSEDELNLAVEVLEDEDVDVVVDEKEKGFFDNLKDFLTKRFWFNWYRWIWLLIALFVLLLIISLINNSLRKQKVRKYYQWKNYRRR